MSVTQEWFIILSCVICLCNRPEILFFKQHRYVTNNVHLYLTNYYIFVYTVTLLLRIVSFAFLNTNISKYYIYTYCNI